MTEEPSDAASRDWWYRSPNGEIFGPYDDVELERYAGEGRLESAGALRHGPESSPWESVDVALGARRSPPSSEVNPGPPQRINPPLSPSAVDASGVSSVSRIAFILLALLPGLVSIFGIHNIVAGYTGKGVTQLVMSLVLIWGMGCVSSVIPPSICLSGVTWIGLLIWSIVEASTVTIDAKGRRFSS